MNAKTILSAAAFAAVFVAGAAQAQGPQSGTIAADKYGYSLRVAQADPFTDGARISNRDGYTDGARSGQFDPFTEGARVNDQRSVYTDGALTVAGLDRTGVSASPARSADPYLDGARTGPRNPYFDGARVNDQRSVYTDGALTVAGLDRTGVSASPARSADPYLDGARISNRDGYTDGNRSGQFDPFTDGARVGDQRSVYSDGARTVAGLDRTGVSASPARKFDVFTDGANA